MPASRRRAERGGARIHTVSGADFDSSRRKRRAARGSDGEESPEDDGGEEDEEGEESEEGAAGGLRSPPKEGNFPVEGNGLSYANVKKFASGKFQIKMNITISGSLAKSSPSSGSKVKASGSRGKANAAKPKTATGPAGMLGLSRTTSGVKWNTQAKGLLEDIRGPNKERAPPRLKLKRASTISSCCPMHTPCM